MIDLNSPQYGCVSHFNKKRFSSNWKTLSLKTSLFLLSTAAILAPGLSAQAEIVIGIIENYSPQSRQATISLGKQDGVGKYDRGKVKLTSLDSPNVEFIGANIVVVSVDDNSAVVSVREAPGVQVPIQAGAEVTLDTDSGIARREEEAKIIAAQQAAEARRQQQLEAALAEKARRQRELEEARAAETRRQRELEEARIQETRRQQQIEEARAVEARRQREIEEARAAAARSQQQSAEPETPPIAVAPEAITPQPEEKSIDLDEARNLWQSESSPDSETSASDLPLDYLQAYTNAREQPSPETHYRFAEVLINYEISDQALTWLEETRSRFPATKPVNNLYRAVALIQQGKIKEGQSILENANLPDDKLTDQFNSYLYTQKGDWDKVFASTESSDSAVASNNRLIALYCTKPFDFERDTDLTPNACPFGSTPTAVENTDNDDVDPDDDDDDDDQDRAEAESEENRATLKEIGAQAIADYPDDPYILNTLGFIALQSEDYELAYEYYQQLAKLVDQYGSTPPRLQLLKANAIEYVNNYNQNYEFLAENGEDLKSLRSRQNSVTDAIIIGGVGSAVTSALSDNVSPIGLIGGVLATFLRFNQSKSRARGIAKERNSIADQMHTTFTKDIDLVPTPPSLEAKSLLDLTSSSKVEPDSSPIEPNSAPIKPNSTKVDLNSPEIDQKMRQFDDFWEKN